jgi:hypothetical protein
MSIQHAVTLLCLLWAAPAQADKPEPALPKTWHGAWVGRLTVRSANGKTFERPWELHIEPLKGGKSLTWRIVSEMDGKKSVRNYELVPDPEKPGQFQLDEKNGIFIDARLMGTTLYSYYKDGDILICTRFEHRGDSLHVELASVSLKTPRVSEIGADKIEIASYQLGSVQAGDLKRKPQ